MKNQKKTSEIIIENLTKSIADNFGKMFQNKYTQEEGISNSGKKFSDLIFLGEVTKEYTESLKEFFALKGYSEKDIAKSNLLEQESPLFFLLQSLLVEKLLVEKKSLSDNRFNQSNEGLKKLTTPEALNQLLEKLKEFVGRKFTQTKQSPVCHSRPNSTMNKESSQKSLNAEGLKLILENIQNAEFEALSQCLYNGFNLYGLIETLYYFTEIKKIITQQLGDAKKDGNKRVQEYDVYTFENVGEAPSYKKDNFSSERIDIINKIKSGVYNDGNYLYFQDKNSGSIITGSIIKVNSRGFSGPNLTSQLQNQLIEKCKSAYLTAQLQKELTEKCKLNQSQELSKISEVPIENFVKRLVNNFKDTFGSKIEEDLKETIKSISAIPSGVSDVFDLLKKQKQGSSPLIISQLEQVQQVFNDSVDKLDKKIEDFIGEEGELTALFNHFKIDVSYFNGVKKSLKKEIQEYTESLKKDVEKQIKEKEFFIGQISEQYLSAYNSACNDKAVKSSAPANDKAQFISNQIVEEVKNNEQIQEKIKDNLPLWIREGITELTYLTIKDDRGDDKEVGFIFNKAQKSIIEALKKKSDKNVVTTNFYVGTGGGKTHLIELLAGTSNSNTKGSDGNEYGSLTIKKAIFGDAGVEIASINFDSFYKRESKNTIFSQDKVNSNESKTDTEINKWINRFFKNQKFESAQNLVIALDEYHKFPETAKKYLKEKAKLFATGGKKVVFIKSTATQNSAEWLYKSLKTKTKKANEQTKFDAQARIAKLSGALTKGYLLKINQGDQKKYHIIIDPTILEDDESIKRYVQSNHQDINIVQKKIDGASFYYVFNNGKLELPSSSSDVVHEYLNSKQLSDFLNLQTPETKIILICPFSTSAGGDFGIGDFSSNTKITIKITDEMKSGYSATEMVDYIRQAVGRDRSFNWKDADSFKNVKLEGIKKEELEKILEKAEYFYGITDDIKNRNKLDSAKICEKDIENLIEYVYSELGKPDLKFFDYCNTVKVIKLINISDKGLGFKDLSNNIVKYSDLLKKEGNENKFDAIFASSLLLNGIIEYLENNKTSTIKNQKTKQFIESIKASYDKIKPNEMFEAITGGEADEFIKNKILEAINNKLKKHSIKPKDVGVSDIDISFRASTEQNKLPFDIKFNLKIMIGADDNDKQNELESLLDQIKVVGGKKFSLDNIPSLRLSSLGNFFPKLDGDPDEPFSSNVENIFNTGGEKVASAEGDKAISLEAKAILHLFNKVLAQTGFDNKDKELIGKFFKNDGEQQGGGAAPTQDLNDNGKLKIIKTALSQRNKYNSDDSKNTNKDRAGDDYKSLKKTLQDLNENNINFTTESLKLFNDSNETLGTRKEVDNLIKEKPLFVRAMGSAKISSFKAIHTTNVPDKNILLLTGTKPSTLQTRLSSLKEKRHNDSNQK